MKTDHTLKDSARDLCERLCSIQDSDTMYAALRDLMTAPEIEEIIQRFYIASLLQKGVSYKEIEQKTGASSTTIARVSKYLKGPLGGYATLLKHERTPG